MKSKKSFQFIIGLTLVSLLLASCSDSFSLQGSLSIVLPASQRTARSALNGIDCSKDDAASYDITLVSEGDGTTRTLSAKPGDSVAVSNLLPGMWTVTAKALNSSNACIGYGTMQTEVKQGQSTEADLSLSLNSSSSITSFKIKSEPSTTSYNLGDTFTLAGLEFEIAFSNGYSMTLGKDNLSLSLSDAAGATVTDGQTAITAADTEITITAAFNNATFTFAIPLTITGTSSSTSIASFSELKNAIENIAASSSGSFVIATTFTTATTDTTTITVSGNITLTAPSGSTSTITRITAQASIPLFTVSSTGSLTLGGSGGSLVIDGGASISVSSSTATNSGVTATAPLISSTGGSLTVSTYCTLQNNYYTPSDKTSLGGAIYMSASSSASPNFTLSGGTITSNYAYSGAGVYIEGYTGGTELSTIYFTNGTISNNVSTTNGGGIYVKYLNITISGTSITKNEANSATVANTAGGGGIFYSGAYSSLSGTCTISSNASITSNTTTSYGGGVFINGGTVTLSNGSISSNTAGATSNYGSNVYLNSGTYTIGTSSTTTATAFDTAQTASN